jgi:RHS repeat-associated protein
VSHVRVGGLFNCINQYDALNRVTQVSYPDQQTQFTYDTCQSGKGRLCNISGASNINYNYGPQGRLSQKDVAMGGVSKSIGYLYGPTGQLSQINTPSGQAISFAYNNNGQPSQININGLPLLTNVQYQPFGGLTEWTWSNATQSTRSYDLDGQLTTLDSAGSRSYTYGPDGSINSITQDAQSNLGVGSSTFANDTGSNRINTITGTLNRSYQYDAVGNTLSDGQRTFTYNDAGRMVSATSNSITTTYLYNALGQRVQKTNTNGTTYYVYDEAGHLIGEYDQAGNLIQELVWLGDIPVASIRNNENGSGVGVFYIHTDHLNAPTKLTRSNDNAIVWRWDHDPFGNGTPNEDPDANGLTVQFNMRYPGQYFDQETGLYYNYFRYYDPQTGKYITSDPIGLDGGLNTYAYAAGNPVYYTDPTGEFVNVIIGSGTSVAMGWLMAKMTGQCYTMKDALTDAALGAAGVGLFSKARNLYRVEKLREIARANKMALTPAQKGVEKYVGNGQMIEIKPGNVRNPNGGINHPGSWPARARYLIEKGNANNTPKKYLDPFTGEVGPLKSPAAHIPLEATAGDSLAIGVAVGVGHAAVDGCGCD